MAVTEHTLNQQARLPHSLLSASRRHLDADEAVVLGAGLVAANRSTQFRVRPFGLVDKVPYGVSYALDDDTEGAGVGWWVPRWYCEEVAVLEEGDRALWPSTCAH